MHIFNTDTKFRILVRSMADNEHFATDSNTPTNKVILLGEVDAGKTTLFYYVREGRYISSERYGPGADYCTKEIQLDEETVKVRLGCSIWNSNGVVSWRNGRISLSLFFSIYCESQRQKKFVSTSTRDFFGRITPSACSMQTRLQYLMDNNT